MSFSAKMDFVTEFTASVKPGMLWDIGCNTGDFSAAALNAVCALCDRIGRRSGCIREGLRTRTRSRSQPVTATYGSFRTHHPIKVGNNLNALVLDAVHRPTRLRLLQLSITWRFHATSHSHGLLAGWLHWHHKGSSNSCQKTTLWFNSCLHCAKTSSLTIASRHSPMHCKRTRALSNGKSYPLPGASCFGMHAPRDRRRAATST